MLEYGGAPLTVSGDIVKWIDYVVTCKDCNAIDIRSMLPYQALTDTGVRFKYDRFGD